MQIDLGRFRAAFFVEAGEHLEQMESALLQLENAPKDAELLNTIFRAAHSIKGGSTTFGADEVGRFTHVVENLLERLRNEEFVATPELIELLLSSVDVIEGLISNARDDAPMPEQVEQVYAELTKFTAAATGETEAPSTAAAPAETVAASGTRYQINFVPSANCFQYGSDPLLMLRDICGLGAVTKFTVDDSRLPKLEDMNPEECYLSWKVELETDCDQQTIDDVAMFLDDESVFEVKRLESESDTVTDKAVAETAPQEKAHPDAQSSANAAAETTKPKRTAPPPRAADNETVRVDRNRLDVLINQIGELVIGASMVEQELVSVTGVSSLESLSGLGKIVRDLQEMSLALRMVPIAATFQKMNRVVRDVAKKIGKQINFVTEGDETELDKSVVDQISDPLIHMVRNAVDHGVETPEERVQAGKPPTGVVKLRAFQQGGNIYIELSDDGKGLNHEKILAKAIERNIILADATLSESEIGNLIFQPGFSTAEKVTDVSGRGVGMDVVRRNVEALQGSVTVKSVPGQGSTISVRLPLTLAILDGLLVRLTEEVFVVPLLSVVESVSIKATEVKQLVGIGEVIQLRGEVLPLLRLHNLLHIRQAGKKDEQILVVIVEDQGKRLALFVDELLGQQQVVIKNLETNFEKVPGVAGATILGDGRVALILDIFGVSQMQTSRGPEATALPAPKCEPDGSEGHDACVESESVGGASTASSSNSVAPEADISADSMTPVESSSESSTTPTNN